MKEMQSNGYNQFTQLVNDIPGVGNKATLKNIYNEEAGELIRSVNSQYGSTPANPQIYQYKLDFIASASTLYSFSIF